MEIVVKAFYPTKVREDKKEIIGTLHVFFPQENIDIRGCRFSRRGHKQFISMPHLRQVDADGKVKTFPILNFSDEEKQKTMKKEFVEAIKAFMEDIIPSLEAKKFKPITNYRQRQKSKKYAQKKTFKKPFKKPYNQRSDRKPYQGSSQAQNKPDWGSMSKITGKKFVDIKK